MTINVNNKAVPCDCLNRCGDDPWLAKGKAEPCEASKKEAARMAEMLHPDNIAVDRFAAGMKEKLAMARVKGRSGWDDPAKCTVEHLSDLLRTHVEKGDPVDVANFCMMLQQRGAGIVSSKGAGPTVAWIKPEEMSAFLRFRDTCEDGEGFDVPKPMMQRLTQIGVIRHCGSGRYEYTDFGQSILEPEFFAALRQHSSSDPSKEG